MYIYEIATRRPYRVVAVDQKAGIASLSCLFDDPHRNPTTMPMAAFEHHMHAGRFVPLAEGWRRFEEPRLRAQPLRAARLNQFITSHLAAAARNEFSGLGSSLKAQP